MRVNMEKDLNGIWCMNIYMDYMPEVNMEEIAVVDGSHYHYGENSDGFVRFGVSYDESTMGHKPGYMWSSRCGVFNTAFGKSLVDITICTPNICGSITRWGFYMTINKALELLPYNFHISMFDAYGEEVFYFIKDGEPDKVFGYEYVCPIFKH